MNIMLINHYAGSPEMGMEYRPFYLAKQWQAMGHTVVIVAASFAHIRTHQPVVSSDFQEDIIHDVKYLWVTTPKYQGNGFARVKNMYVFTRKLKKKASFLAKKYKPDLVIASSTYPLDNYPARKIAQLSGAKYFYEVHDLWPLSPKELGGMPAYHPFIMWMQKAENYAYRHADKVVSMLPATLEYMKSHGLSPEKWMYVPNGINTEEWEKIEPLNKNTAETLSDIKRRYKTTVAYTGSFGIANALWSLLDAAEALRDEGVAVILAGGGPELENLRKIKREKALDNVFFISAVPKKQMPALLQKFDFLYIGLQRQSLFRFGISPNKLIDYMMAGKPVIQAVEAGNNMVEEASCGIAVEPENPGALVDAVKRLMKTPAAELEKMGKNGRAFVLAHHDYKVLAGDFLSGLR